MKGDHLNKLLRIGAAHALYHEEGKWYHNLKEFPGVLFDRNGYILFRTVEEYNSNPFLLRNKDLFITCGIESLQKYQPFTEFQRILIGGVDVVTLNSASTSEETIRVMREINIILRKKTLVSQIKKLYDNACQICGTRLTIGNHTFYSEVHHIVPLGRPHNGIDHMSNMICVCPNCHVQLDLKSIRIDIRSLRALKHEITLDYLEFHNNQVQ